MWLDVGWEFVNLGAAFYVYVAQKSVEGLNQPFSAYEDWQSGHFSQPPKGVICLDNPH